LNIQQRPAGMAMIRLDAFRGRLKLDRLFAERYVEIRRLAKRVGWNSANSTLNATALANEAYIKLRKDPPELASRSYAEVIGIFSNAMHQILIDAARRRNALKRGAVGQPEKAGLAIEEVIAIGDALKELEREIPRQALIVRCRFYLGMTVDETAIALGLSKTVVERGWRDAKLRLSIDTALASSSDEHWNATSESTAIPTKKTSLPDQAEASLFWIAARSIWRTACLAFSPMPSL